MRIFVRLVDENGLFIEDAFVDELTEFTIETPCPSGFYRPKWNGEKWVEGLTQEEINELKKPRPKEISLEERLEQTEQLLQATTMAFTEFMFSQAMGKQHDDN